jgi:hypothetical protein
MHSSSVYRNGYTQKRTPRKTILPLGATILDLACLKSTDVRRVDFQGTSRRDCRAPPPLPVVHRKRRRSYECVMMNSALPWLASSPRLPLSMKGPIVVGGHKCKLLPWNALSLRIALDVRYARPHIVRRPKIDLVRASRPNWCFAARSPNSRSRSRVAPAIFFHIASPSSR